MQLWRKEEYPLRVQKHTGEIITDAGKSKDAAAVVAQDLTNVATNDFLPRDAL